NCRDEGGLTPLHWAAENLRLEAATVLARNGADLQAKDAGGYTPLSLAAGHYGPRAGRVADGLLALCDPLDLFGALARHLADDVRKILDEDPEVIAQTLRPESLLAMAVALIGQRIIERTRVGPSYRRDRAASGIPVQDDALVEATVLEHIDLIDLLI